MSSNSASLPSSSTLAEEELVDSLSWLIAIRWLAGIGVLLAGFLVTIVDINIPITPLYLLGFGLLVYNAILWLGLRHLDASPTDFTITYYQWFARIQIGMDWVAMALLVHFSGGIESPAILYFLFHITIASLLLPHDKGLFYVTLAPVLVGGVAFLEYRGVLPHVNVFKPARYDNPLYIAGILFFFSTTAYIMTYFAMTISRRLRRREDELAGLYQSVRTTTLTLDLPEVMNRLAEATAQALDCKGVAIRLLDKTGSSLEMVAAYGLSETYWDKSPIEVARARIDQEALSGKTVSVPDATHDPRLRYPKKVAAEGIHAILSAPLIGKREPIGVLRAYGGTAHRFTQDDAAFLSAIAAQGTVAIENAQAYQLLEDIDKNKSQFVRMITHELRSPVQVTSSLLTVLGRGYVGDLNEKQTDMVDRARRRVKFLEILIDDLLDLAAGKADVLATTERGIISLSDVLQEVVARFETHAEDKGIELHFKHPDKALHVWGDKSELDRILNNLVSNAIKYTQEGDVCISMKQARDFACIAITDTGIGIPQGVQSQLFQEFYRAPNAKATGEAGTGLGLAIVKDLVDRYGGCIDVESAEGQGSKFTIRFPVHQNETS
ncbi:MAG: GAF domain-containing sensor histidine kinase [Chloroflexi bacterium]|nr:GAF domain-containing sensor histidine kinase [Chloroflexota bacterium]